MVEVPGARAGRGWSENVGSQKTSYRRHFFPHCFASFGGVVTPAYNVGVRQHNEKPSKGQQRQTEKFHVPDLQNLKICLARLQ